MTSSFDTYTSDDFKRSVMELGYEIHPKKYGQATNIRVANIKRSYEHVTEGLVFVVAVCIFLSACCHLTFGRFYGNYFGLGLFGIALFSFLSSLCLSVFRGKWGPRSYNERYPNNFIRDCPENLRRLFVKDELGKQYVVEIFYYRPPWSKRYRIIVDITPHQLSVAKDGINPPEPWSFSFPIA